MGEYIEREALLKDILESVVFTVRGDKPSLEIRGANKIIDRIKSAPTADVVSREVFEQVKWERDTALHTLQEHGIGLGEKADVVEVVRCKNCEYFSFIDYNIKKCEEHSDCWGDHTVYVDEDDYCSYGKRKEGADND